MSRESTSRSSREYTYNELNAKDLYSSNFPSLLTNLGSNAKKKARKKEISWDELQLYENTSKKNEREHEAFLRSQRHRRQSTLEDDLVQKETKGYRKERSEYVSFGEEMRRTNEALWMKIEAVAKEKLFRYECYTTGMATKLKKQRENINRRSEELLKSLAKEEQKKREENIFNSPYGRMWRHHRSMQRRAFSLEPMKPQKIGRFFSL